MKKIVFIILAMLLPLIASAATTSFKVDGISYETLEDDNQAVMVINGNTKYSGDVVIPATVTSGGKTYTVKKIGKWAFWECTGLKSIVLPEGLVEIENSSFTGCTGLKALTIPTSVVSIDGTAWSDDRGAFEGCTGLKSVYFPSTMKVSQLYEANIGGRAFYGCTGLKTIYVAGSETAIAMYDVFGGCTAVTDFVSNIQNPKATYVDVRSFQGFIETANLIVPDGKKIDYQGSNDWYLFKHIYERSGYTKAFAIVKASQGGKVSYGNESVTIGTQVWGIAKGQSATFTITPDEGHKLLKLLKDGVDVTSSVSNGQYIVSNVQSDFTLEAFFEEGTTPTPQPQTDDKGTAKLSIESFEIKAGENKTMLIDMQNPEDQVTLVQFDLRLPDGLSIATGDDAIDIAGRTTWKKHTLTSNATNGVTRILLYSSTNAVIDGTSGAIISIKLVASSSFKGGDIKLENQLMTTPSLVESKPAVYTYNIKGGGNNPEKVPLEMTFKVLNAVDGVVYYDKPCIKMAWKNISEKEFKGEEWFSCYKRLDNGEWSDKIYSGSSMKITLKPGKDGWSSQSLFGFGDGFYIWEWGYKDENDNMVSMGTTIIEVRGHDRYRAIWLDSDIDNGTMKTFCDEENLNFSHTEGLKAYIATTFNPATSEVQMQKISNAAGGTGLLLVGQPGCYLAERSASASTYSSNMLVGVLGETKQIKPNENGYANYVYNTNNRNNKEKFIIASDKGSYIRSNEAYLRVPTQDAGDIQTVTPVFDESTISSEAYAVLDEFTLTFYYDDQRSKRSGTIYSLNEGAKEPEWVNDDNNRNVEKVVFDASFAKARPTTTYSWFLNCDILREIENIECLNTSEVRNMHIMFAFCKKLESVDVSHFDTRKVEDMGAMFSNCKSLKSIDLSNFDTSNLWMMMSMFIGCNNLTEINLSSFNTSKVEYLSYLFNGCSNLKTLYFGSGFTSTNSVSCEEVFVDCPNLSKVVFTGDIPASINSTFFDGVGSANAPVKLDVPELYTANYEAKFNGNMFYGGYFTLREAIVPNGENGGKDYGNGNGEIDENTDLNGSIIGNVYYNIAPKNGGYNAAEGCLIVTQPSSDFEGEDPFGDDFKGMFTGIVIMVQPGSGTVKVEAETSGGMSLIVKVGNNQPIKMSFQSKSTLAIPYNVDRPTYVYIYAGGVSATRAGSENALKIYSVSWESTASDISDCIDDGQPFDVYSLSGTLVKKGATSLKSLPKGTYIVNRRKVMVK